MTAQPSGETVATTGRVVRGQIAALARDLRDADDATWNAPSACTEWALGDVAAHMAESNDRFLQIIEATLAGREPPSFSPQLRAERQATVKAGGRTAVLDQLEQRVGAVFDRLEAASPEQLTRTIQVPAGDLTLAQVAGQRLTEVTLHCWDVRSAREPGATLPSDATALLLDSILTNVPRLAKKAGLEGARGTYHLVLSGEGGGSTTVELEPGAARARRGAPDRADATLHLPAETAIRLFWGRLDLERAIADGLVRLDGDPAAARTLNRAFHGE